MTWPLKHDCQRCVTDGVMYKRLYIVLLFPSFYLGLSEFKITVPYTSTYFIVLVYRTWVGLLPDTTISCEPCTLLALLSGWRSSFIVSGFIVRVLLPPRRELRLLISATPGTKVHLILPAVMTHSSGCGLLHLPLGTSDSARRSHRYRPLPP